MPAIPRTASRWIVLLAALVAPAAPIACAGEKEEVKVDLIVTVPKDTPDDSVIYIAGNLPEAGAWQLPGVPLKPRGDGAWHVQLRLPHGDLLEYKITRGSWETVEKGPAGEEIDNRTLKLERDLTERIAVAGWRTDTPGTQPGEPRKSTVTGELRTHELQSTILNNTRRVLVWLPPAYDAEPQRRYPTLYMHDGQNLFDDATSFAGEWHADETAHQLVEAGRVEPVIIVGIENTWERVHEYTPSVAVNVGGKGELYARFLVEEVKPLIDRTYRTKPGPADTAVAGSSLGGLISLYLIERHGEVFGRCGAVSPSLWWGDRKYLRQLESAPAFAKGKRIWLDTGTRESADPAKSRENVADCQALADALAAAGLKHGVDFHWQAFEGAQHNEQAWADRFDEMLIFLFGRP